jgi:ribosomal protein S12 methylthiotransferase accessory factor
MVGERMDWMPTFHESYAVDVVGTEALLLVGDGAPIIIRSRIATAVASLLDGTRRIEDIVAHLAGRFDPSEVHYLLLRMRRDGYLVGAPAPDRGIQADVGVNTGLRAATAKIRPLSVAIHTSCALDAELLESTLRRMGIQVRDGGDIHVFLVEDYLDDDLAAWNKMALAKEQLWMLAKPTGDEIWVGPLFIPGTTACWSCMEERLRARRKVEAFRKNRTDVIRIVERPSPSNAAMSQTALGMVATAVGAWQREGRFEPMEGKIVSFHPETFRQETHEVVGPPPSPTSGRPKQTHPPPPPIKQQQKPNP